MLHPVVASGIFPEVHPDATRDNPDELAPNLEGWDNYTSFEEAEAEAWGLLESHLEPGYLEVFDSIVDRVAVMVDAEFARLHNLGPK